MERLKRILLHTTALGLGLAELSYEGEAGSDSVAHALTATVRFDW